MLFFEEIAFFMDFRIKMHSVLVTVCHLSGFSVWLYGQTGEHVVFEHTAQAFQVSSSLKKGEEKAEWLPLLLDKPSTLSLKGKSRNSYKERVESLHPQFSTPTAVAQFDFLFLR